MAYFQCGGPFLHRCCYVNVLTLPRAYHNNPRPGILVLNGFLLFGSILLCFVNVEKGAIQAAQFDKKQEEAPEEGEEGMQEEVG